MSWRVCVETLVPLLLFSVFPVLTLPFPEREQPEHHGLCPKLLSCVVNSVTCMTESVCSRSSSGLVYIRILQMNLCTDFALVVPHAIFSALVNKKKEGKCILVEIFSP